MFKTHTLICMALLLSACSEGLFSSSSSSIPKTKLSLSWLSPTEDEVGNGLLEHEISGFNIYYGTENGHYTSSIYIDKPDSNSFILSDFPEGEYYFAMKAVLETGEESDFSEEFYINTES